MEDDQDLEFRAALFALGLRCQRHVHAMRGRVATLKTSPSTKTFHRTPSTKPPSTSTDSKTSLGPIEVPMRRLPHTKR
jgi:hypothetical protein